MAKKMPTCLINARTQLALVKSVLSTANSANKASSVTNNTIFLECVINSKII